MISSIQPALVNPSIQRFLGSAFRYLDRLSGEIVIPSNITSFATYCFSKCPNLKKATICGAAVTTGLGMFRYCESLEEVVFPSSLTAIPNYALGDCPNLSSITIPRMTAPTASTYTFGGLNNVLSSYCGNNSSGTGMNVLRIPQGATGYETGYWSSVLLDPNKCGFHIEYIT